MGAGDPPESELEQELDSLYRKVAGLDQSEDAHSRTVLKTGAKTPTAANIQRPISTNSAQKAGRRFLAGRFVGGLVFTLLCLGTIGFFSWHPLKTHRLTGKAVAPAPAEERARLLAELPAADTPPGGNRQARYAIQIRAYPEDQKQNAVTFLEDLRKRSPDASMETVLIAERGVWHRILLGSFSTPDEAAEYRRENGLAREYPYSFIQRKFASGP